ncbi:hypothetical protein [Aliihoeflea sp. 40Bstr573]|uniref:hypothetical protein n=1 Tax=Aliihoeflea sp. 40Bstr573 TaxID=2696467 RepID=UPI0020953C04|nr:hypothetical protein [Aliihoeflea sp. 40Bstr573]MCO6388052.1 hypothetical protein [Aliihoeflea sp. 40Bstr573]
MKKIILASVSGLALMGLAACTDAEDPAAVDTGAPVTTENPAAAPADTTTPPASTDGMAPAPAE